MTSGSEPPVLSGFLRDGGARARWGNQEWRCAVGRGGVAEKQREGDGITPVGRWPLRRVLYRADRIARPVTVLPCQPIAPDDGWCDDPADPAYNRPVRLPYPARHERLTRDDHLYRSEEHTSELQSLMRISYAVFCLKKKKTL